MTLQLFFQKKPSLLIAWLFFFLISLPLAAEEKAGPSFISIAPTVEQVSPAVVHVSAESVPKNNQRLLFFEQFFGFGPAVSGFPKQVENSLGSGVIVRKDGLVITNYHVIDGAEKVFVTTADGKRHSAKVAVQDPKADLALLKIEGSDFPTVSLAPLFQSRTGDFVVALGYPYGMQSVTFGCISALVRDNIMGKGTQLYVQTDAAINMGNSGGPLVTLDNKLLAINTMLYSKTGAFSGISFATPADYIPALIQAYDENKPFMRPWAGFVFEKHLNSQEKASLSKMPAIVRRILKNSPAEKAGLKAGDQILEVNGFPVPSMAFVYFAVDTASPGDELTFKVQQGNDSPRTLKIQLASPKASETKPIQITGRLPLSGLTVAEISPQLIQKWDFGDIGEGVAITHIRRGSPAYNLGFEPGDILLSVNDVTLDDLDRLSMALRRGARGWKITFLRRGLRQTLHIR